MEITKVAPRGYCKGVVRAIQIAKDTASLYPDQPIYILGMLVHNAYITEALRLLNITSIDSSTKTRLELLDEIEKGVIIFTAHGVHPKVKQKAKDKGLICIDASCADVIKTQNMINDYRKQGYEILYVGKKRHPEAEAVYLYDSHIHLIEHEDDFHNLSLSTNKIFVTNQTTMSTIDTSILFKKIKIKYPEAIINNEICSATRIRQEAVANLKNKDIDLLYIVGDHSSNNVNRLKEIGILTGIAKVILIESASQIHTDDLLQANHIAITSGASTPTYITNQVIQYLEHYDENKIAPIINVRDLL